MSLACIVPDVLWHAQQPLRFGPIAMTSRMTVVRLGDGDLWVHSPVSPTPALVAQIRALGRVRHAVAPNKSHHLFFLDFLDAFPEASGYVAPGLPDKRPDLGRFAEIPVDVPWGEQLRGYFIEGLPIINETVWFHAATGSLIVTDLLFCFSRAHRGLAALVSGRLGVRGTLNMSRTMKLAVRDKQRFAASVRPLLSLPVRRVILAHDEIVEDHPVDRLARAFAWLQ